MPSHELPHFRPPTAADICSHFSNNGQVTLDPSKVGVAVCKV